MKCGRCHKDVQVLTPSPDGDQDLCGDCYAAVYRQLHAARGFPKLPVIAAVIAAVVVVAGVYALVSGKGTGEVAQAPARKSEGIVLPGPNKPDPSKSAPPKKPAAKPAKAAETPATPAAEAPETESRAKTEEEVPAPETAEKTEEGASEQPETEEAKKGEAHAPESKPEEPQPKAAQIETASFVMSPAGTHQTGQVSISVRTADGQTTTQQITAPEQETLYEVSLNVKPTSDNDVVLAGLSLRVGETPYVPIQARIFGSSYLAPSESTLFLSESATVIVTFNAEQESVAVSERGDELVAARKDRPASIPVTFLFALPKGIDGSTDAAIVLPEGEVATALR